MAEFSWHTLETTDYQDDLFEVIKNVEKYESQPYLDSASSHNPTIGVGFNLRDSNVLTKVLLEIFYPDDGKSSFLAEDLTYKNQINTLVHESWDTKEDLQAALNSIMADRAADTDVDYLNKRTTFDFVDEPSANVAFTALQDTYEDVVNSWLSGIPESNERTALFSLAYNQTSENPLLGPSLKAAIEAGNRAEAWYEIRYNSNGDDSTGIAKRRYYESEQFGLQNPDDIDKADAKKIFQMVTHHIGDIETYDGLYGTQVGLAQSDYGVAVQTTTAAVSNALTLLEAIYAPGKTLDKVWVDYTVSGAETNNLDFHTRSENALFLGGKGNDTLKGGTGDDVYGFDIGDGLDSIEDSHGSNAASISNDFYGNVYLTVDSSHDDLKISYTGGTITAKDQFTDHTLSQFVIGSGAKYINLSVISAEDLYDSLTNDPVSMAAATIYTAYSGHDNIVGSDVASPDHIYGDASANEITGGRGNDIIKGGAGSDTYNWNLGDGWDFITDDWATSSEKIIFGPGVIGDMVQISAVGGGDLLLSIDNAAGYGGQITLKGAYGGDFDADNIGGIAYYQADPVTSGPTLEYTEVPDGMGGYTLVDQADTVNGTSGNDDIYGGDYDDTLNGDDGADHIVGGAGSLDTLNGGGGNDLLEDADGGTLNGGADNDTLIAYGSTTTTFNGGSGEDIIQAHGTGTQIINGGTGEDIISIYAASSSTIDGGDNNDTVFIGSGDATIIASSGSDVLYHNQAMEDVATIRFSGTLDMGDLTRELMPNGRDLLITHPDGDILLVDFVAHPDYWAVQFGTNTPVGLETLSYDVVYESSDPVVFTSSETLILASMTLGDANDYADLSPSAGTDVSAGAGQDIIIAGASGTIHGGDDIDIIYGGTGVSISYGDDGDDIIINQGSLNVAHGGNGADTLYGPGTIYGDDGDDHITAAGNTVIYGGSGEDTIGTSYTDDNIIHGDDGNDTITINSSGNTVYGDDGDDVITVELGPIDTPVTDNTIDGGAGINRIIINSFYATDHTTVLITDGYTRLEDDFVHAGTTTIDFGNTVDVSDLVGTYTADGVNGHNLIIDSGLGMVDVAASNVNMAFGSSAMALSLDHSYTVLTATSGEQFISTLDGNIVDEIHSGASDDTFYTGGGADLIYAGAGDNEIHAGSGNDNITTLGGADWIFGGDGNDTIDSGAGNDLIQGDGGADNIHGGDGNDTIIAGDGVTSDGANDMLYGDAGNDSLTADSSGDTLYGGDGTDTLYNVGGTANGGNDNDTIYSSFGTANGDAGADYISLSGAGTANGGTGADTVAGSSSADVINGGDDGDNLSGNAGDDLINGDAGADTIYGGNDNDTLNGGTGVDYVSGDAGNDIINGQGGQDNLFGGTGADTFKFDDTWTGYGDSDIIYDFSLAQGDKIDLSQLLDTYDPLTDPIANFVNFTVVSGVGTYVSIDQSGSGTSFTAVAGLAGVAVTTSLTDLITNGNLIV